jgi:hypothetical protein
MTYGAHSKNSQLQSCKPQILYSTTRIYMAGWRWHGQPTRSLQNAIQIATVQTSTTKALPHFTTIEQMASSSITQKRIAPQNSFQLPRMNDHLDDVDISAPSSTP